MIHKSLGSALLASRWARFMIDNFLRESSQSLAKALKSFLVIINTDETSSLRMTPTKKSFNPPLDIYVNKSSTAALSLVNSSVEILIFSFAKSDNTISLTISTLPSGVVIKGMPQIIPSGRS